MSTDQIIEAVEAATKTLKVLVPSTDYYARQGDSDTDYLQYIDPEIFVEKLREITSRTEKDKPKKLTSPVQRMQERSWREP